MRARHIQACIGDMLLAMPTQLQALEILGFTTMDGVRLSSNSQMFRPVDSNGNYMGYEERVYSGSYERAYCYEGQSGSRMYLKVSKPEGISDSVKISTYGFFVGTVGT